ncbi:MAG TPA: type II secretion system protein [Candidatus Saccharimonadales bacterium]
MRKRSQRGFSAVEVLLAATVFGLLVSALIGAIIYGRQSTANAGDRGRANLLAEEGLEAVRNIRNANYANISNGTFGLTNSSGVWNFSGTSDTTDIYTRQITITDNGADRKVISSRVTWTTSGQARETVVTTQLTNWLAAITPPAPTSGPIMMAYSKTTNTPFYRTWDGSSWSAEGSAMTVGGNINYIVVKSSSIRNETVLGTQDASGAIYFQVWNGTSWGNRTQVGTGPATTRSFDISYENTTGRAIIAYSAGADFAYRIWDGSTLSTATTITAPPTTGAINWIELQQNPLNASNEIALLLLDANADVYGMRWTGSAWNNMGAATVWDATASSAARKGIDIEYEQSSGHILFAWGDSVSTDMQYRTWNGTTLSAATLLDIPAMLIANWVQMAARPGSDEIMLGIQDSGGGLNTRKWSGTAWDTATQHPEHDTATENVASRNFDVIWETYSTNLGKAWLTWGDGATRTDRQWSATAWGTATVASGSDDTSFVRLRADPVSGAVFSGVYQCSCSATAARDINERRLVNGGATWSGSTQMWGGPTTVDPVHFRVDITMP